MLWSASVRHHHDSHWDNAQRRHWGAVVRRCIESLRWECIAQEHPIISVWQCGWAGQRVRRTEESWAARASWPRGEHTHTDWDSCVAVGVAKANYANDLPSHAPVVARYDTKHFLSFSLLTVLFYCPTAAITVHRCMWVQLTNVLLRTLTTMST